MNLESKSTMPRMSQTRGVVAGRKDSRDRGAAAMNSSPPGAWVRSASSYRYYCWNGLVRTKILAHMRRLLHEICIYMERACCNSLARRFAHVRRLLHELGRTWCNSRTGPEIRRNVNIGLGSAPYIVATTVEHSMLCTVLCRIHR